MFFLSSKSTRLIYIREWRFTSQRDRIGDTNALLYSEVKITTVPKVRQPLPFSSNECIKICAHIQNLH